MKRIRQSERGGALQVVLIVLGVIVLIVALVVLAAVVMVNRFVKVEVDRGEEGKRVAVHTPFGEFVAEIYRVLWHYNHTRIHSALKMPPSVFAEQLLAA